VVVQLSRLRPSSGSTPQTLRVLEAHEHRAKHADSRETDAVSLLVGFGTEFSRAEPSSESGSPGFVVLGRPTDNAQHRVLPGFRDDQLEPGVHVVVGQLSIVFASACARGCWAPLSTPPDNPWTDASWGDEGRHALVAEAGDGVE
jgi:hypothetical protein